MKGAASILGAVALVTSLIAVPTAPAAASATSRVIVLESGEGTGPEDFVQRAGGEVTRQFSIIDGFVAEVPASIIPALSTYPGVLTVTPDGSLESHGKNDRKRVDDGTDTESTYDGEGRSIESAIAAIGADSYWDAGFTGNGVGVALIDTGIVPVDGLQTPGKVFYGPDLSFESQSDQHRYLDTNGHGTHLAGIITGRENLAPKELDAGDLGRYFLGIAPDTHLLSMKVGTADGSADVSQVIAAIDWVVQHRNDNGMNIRVINLAFGTDGTQSYLTDPLAFAVEAAWRNGLVVVVAAGNDGNAFPVRNPATNPHVIAVGSVDHMDSAKTGDDRLSPFANCGTNVRHIDLVAPGQSIVSLRNPGSAADIENADSRVSERKFRGTGTSQAAAFVAGAAALMIDQRPGLTPDQVKALLMGTASDLRRISGICEGSGLPNLAAAFATPAPNALQQHTFGSGTGSLEAARGSIHVSDAGGELIGEQDIFGAAWDGVSWAPSSLAANSWSGGAWNGNSWSGNSWSGNSWSGNSWSANSWSGNSWSANSWSANSWSGNSWSGNSWSANSWSANSWSANSWSANSWSANHWS
jgi:serine protease AprX